MTARPKPGTAQAERSPRLGAHMSIAGAFTHAIEMGLAVGCDTIQVFTKSNNQWAAPPIPPAQAAAFRRAAAASGITPCFAHSAYLINLGSPTVAIAKQSEQALRVELERAEQLGLAFVVLHPGAHKETGEEACLARIAAAAARVLKATAGAKVQLLYETAAGQGSCVGHRFEQLATLLARTGHPDRVGICFDTCHVFAAGYDLTTEAGYRQTMAEFDRVVGLDRLRAIHLNDSKKELGCRVDRHEHIGHGAIGLTAFRCLMNDPRLAHIPMVLETPKDDDCAEDRMNLATLRRLLKKPRRLLGVWCLLTMVAAGPALALREPATAEKSPQTLAGLEEALARAGSAGREQPTWLQRLARAAAHRRWLGPTRRALANPRFSPEQQQRLRAQLNALWKLMPRDGPSSIALTSPRGLPAMIPVLSYEQLVYTLRRAIGLSFRGKDPSVLVSDGARALAALDQEAFERRLDEISDYLEQSSADQDVANQVIMFSAPLAAKWEVRELPGVFDALESFLRAPWRWPTARNLAMASVLPILVGESADPLQFRLGLARVFTQWNLEQEDFAALDRLRREIAGQPPEWVMRTLLEAAARPPAGLEEAERVAERMLAAEGASGRLAEQGFLSEIAPTGRRQVLVPVENWGWSLPVGPAARPLAAHPGLVPDAMRPIVLSAGVSPAMVGVSLLSSTTLPIAFVLDARIVAKDPDGWARAVGDTLAVAIDPDQFWQQHSRRLRWVDLARLIGAAQRLHAAQLWEAPFLRVSSVTPVLQRQYWLIETQG